MSNLTKIQKLVFAFLIFIIIGLAGYIVYFSFIKKDNDSKIDQPVSIQQLNCDQAKNTLADIYGDPELDQVYKDVKIISFNNNILTIQLSNDRPVEFVVTTATKIEKIDNTKSGNPVVAGSLDDLKPEAKAITLNVNPLKEVEYVALSVQ